jgi:hypothetical protein
MWAVFTHGLLLFGRVSIHRRWYKALKKPGGTSKMFRKGVILLWITTLQS